MSFIKFLGYLWMFPYTFLTWSWLWGLYALGWVEFRGLTPDTQSAIFVAVKDKALSNLWMKRWPRLIGIAPGGPFVLLRFDYVEDTPYWKRTICHEDQHVKQQMVFGVLMGPLYLLASVFIWVFLRSRHSYYDNPFEINARKAAGQLVRIPRKNWADPYDRWLWW